MNCKIILLFCFFLIFSCDQNPKKINYESGFKNYTNKGFTLIYDEKLYKNKDLNRKMNDRSLLVFSNALKKETPVKITNLINGKYLIAKVGKKTRYPEFYNSVISKRIAEDLNLDVNQPYIELKTLDQNNSFIIGKAKTFEEEKEVIKSKDIFNYIIKIADLYFLESAKILKERLANEYNINNVKIIKLSKNNYRIYKGPFKNLESIKKDYKDIIKLNFENIEIIKL